MPPLLFYEGQPNNPFPWTFDSPVYKAHCIRLERFGRGGVGEQKMVVSVGMRGIFEAKYKIQKKN